MKGRTGGKGEYRIEGIPAGTRQVTASKFGYVTQIIPVEVLEGETTIVNFELTKISVPLKKRIVEAFEIVEKYTARIWTIYQIVERFLLKTNCSLGADERRLKSH